MSQSKKVSKDSYLFREGDAPDAMYIIKSGQFAVTKTKGTSEVVLAEIKAGAMVGEMAIFDKKPRSANVKAMKESEVVALPYEALEKQLDALPVWIKAIMKTMNENMREANKKIKILENPEADAERFPPHVVNKLLSIINLVGHKYGQKNDAGEGLLLPANRLRNFTIQIFQEPTNKMESMQSALQELGYFIVEDLGEGRKRLVNLQPDFLMDFVDWYNDWLFKQEKDKVYVTADDIKILTAVLHFAKKVEPDAKGVRKINLADIQNDSMRDLGYLVKGDDVNPLIEKGLVSEKIMEESGVFIGLQLENIERPAAFWKLVWDLKKILR
ncbi:MAG TPA: cyclic nucleotide-binding domain-containing protein [Pseudobdellovibrionaceae bacterium]|nr:cyclic nucleotide-binding domain-containing protein [Pseudobdellovibrionaceae bacterium]